MQKRKYITCDSVQDFESFFDRWGEKLNHIKEYFRWYCSEFDLYPMTQSKYKRRLRLILDISTTNSNIVESEFYDLVREYHDTNTSQSRELDIRHGYGSGGKYISRLETIHRSGAYITTDKIEYWINKGFTKEEAILEKKRFYNAISRKGIDTKNNIHSKNPEKKRIQYERIRQTKLERRTLEYWTGRGYTESQAVENINRYIPPLWNLEYYIEKWGESAGREKHRKRYEKAKNTKIERYGNSVLCGYVSKSSIKFFKTLYKLLRKCGISKDDIKWGIGNRREFTTHHKETCKNYSYDFVILSKKIMLEYNDPFWHARTREEWRNPMVTYDDSYHRDMLKKQIANTMGFDVIYIWSDNLPDINELKKIILK